MATYIDVPQLLPARCQAETRKVSQLVCYGRILIR